MTTAVRVFQYEDVAWLCSPNRAIRDLALDATSQNDLQLSARGRVEISLPSLGNVTNRKRVAAAELEM